MGPHQGAAVERELVAVERVDVERELVGPHQGATVERRVPSLRFDAVLYRRNTPKNTAFLPCFPGVPRSGSP